MRRHGSIHSQMSIMTTPIFCEMVRSQPCFEELEELDFPPQLGRLEAAVTSGGLSTAPWTFEGKIERLENKTLRYPGHWAQFVFSIRAVRT